MSKVLKQIEEEVHTYIEEARSLLPNLPLGISFIWDDNVIIPGNGTGGSLAEPCILAIGYDPHFKDTHKLSKHLRATVLHECFHAVQGWSDKNPIMIPENLLEDGVLEGAATVFEREYGHASPKWGHYEGDITMARWYEEIKSLKLSPNSDAYADYKFGEVRGVTWMLYKVGTWVADKALINNSQLSVVDLSTMHPKDIIKLAEV